MSKSVSKRIVRTTILSAAVLGLGLWTGGAFAAPQTWDPNDDEGATGNSGNWGTAALQWADGTAANAISLGWTQANDAIFGGTGGGPWTITLDEAIAANSVTINTAGYTIGAAAAPALTTNTITANDSAAIAADMVITAAGAYDVALGKTLTVTGIIGDGASNFGFTKSGAGTLYLKGINTFGSNNAININAGTVQIDAESGLGAATNDIVFGGGTLRVSGSFTPGTGKTYAVGTSSSAIEVDASQTLTLPSTAGLVTADTTGVLALSGAGKVIIQSTNVAFDGTWKLDAGELEIRNANSLGDATNRPIALLSGGNLRLARSSATTWVADVVVDDNSSIIVDRTTSGTGLNQTLGTLSMGGGKTLTVTQTNYTAAPTLIFGATTLTGDATIDSAADVNVQVGAITAGSNTLTKAGAGRLILAADVVSGTLKLDNAALGTSASPRTINNLEVVGNSYIWSVSSTAWTINGAVSGTGKLIVGGTNRNAVVNIPTTGNSLGGLEVQVGKVVATDATSHGSNAIDMNLTAASMTAALTYTGSNITVANNINATIGAAANGNTGEWIRIGQNASDLGTLTMTGTLTLSNSFVAATPAAGATVKLSVGNNGILDYQGKITGTGNIGIDVVTVNNTGLVKLSNATNDFVGDVLLRQQNVKLVIAAPGALGNPSNRLITMIGQAAWVQFDASMTLPNDVMTIGSNNWDTNGNDVTMSGLITGDPATSAFFNKKGLGTLTLTNPLNTFGGVVAGGQRTVNIQGGVLATPNDGALGNSALPNNVSMDGGSFRATESFSSARVFNATATGGSILVDATKTLTLTGTLSGGLLGKGGDGTLTVNGPQSFGVGSTFTVSAGTVNLNTDAGTAATAGPTAAVANLTLNISGTGVVNFGTAQDLLKLSSTVAGGANLAGNAARIYTLADEAQLNSDVFAGKVIDSTISTNPWQIGITDQKLDAAGNPMLLVQVTRKGDANLDGTTNFTDLLRLSQNYGVSGKLFDEGDFNYDGTVNFNDLLILSQNYGQSYPAPAAPVPEPGVLGVLAIGAAGLLGRRRR